MDILSGKSIPVLLAVTLYHLDPHLLGTMVLLGATVGTVINIHKTSKKPASDQIEWWFRIIHLSFGAWLSITLLHRILGYMHPAGVLLATIPSFWVIIQPVPERPITLCFIFLLTMVLFYMSLIISPEMLIDSDTVRQHQRQLQAINKYDWYKSHKIATYSPPVDVHPVESALPGSIIILVLSTLSTIQNGPLYNFTSKYCSPSLLFNRTYSVFACIVAALFRSYIIITIGWMQHNILHLLLEGSQAIFWACWVWIVLLLMTINWHVTHVSYNLLTIFKGNPNDFKLKYTIILFAIGYMYPWTQFNFFLVLLTTLQILSITLYVLLY
jgi:hypothetical protein